MTKVRRTYDSEFKREALRLLETSDKSAAQIEQDLGIGQGCLSRWKREQAKNGEHAFPGQGRLIPEQEHLRRLERENKILRQERDILKKQSPSSRTQADEISVHRRPSGRMPGDPHVRGAGCVAQRLLCLARPTSQRERDGEPRTGQKDRGRV